MCRGPPPAGVAPGTRHGGEHEPLRTLIPIQAVAFLFQMTLHILLTLIPLYLYHLGLSPAVLGFLVAFPSLFQTFMRVPAGMASDRWGEKAVLLISSGSMILASLLFLPRIVAIAIIGTMWGLSLFLTPLLFGVLAQVTSVEVCFLVAALPLLIMGLLTGPLFKWAYGAGEAPQSG